MEITRTLTESETTNARVRNYESRTTQVTNYESRTTSHELPESRTTIDELRYCVLLILNLPLFKFLPSGPATHWSSLDV